MINPGIGSEILWRIETRKVSDFYYLLCKAYHDGKRQGNLARGGVEHCVRCPYFLTRPPFDQERQLL